MMKTITGIRHNLDGSVERIEIEVDMDKAPVRRHDDEPPAPVVKPARAARKAPKAPPPEAIDA